jgi:hypothetical protein
MSEQDFEDFRKKILDTPEKPPKVQPQHKYTLVDNQTPEERRRDVLDTPKQPPKVDDKYKTEEIGK